jgi:hypothetical protein
MARPSLLLVVAVTLAACSGGGDNGNGGGNPPPLADAGNDQTVVELTNVQLAGAGSDPAGEAVSFSWSQTAGTSVTLNNATSATANFIAPDAAAGVPEVLTFQLTVTDAAGFASSDSVTITVQEPSAVVTISGNMFYEFPPPVAACNGLDFGNIQVRPIRQATVQMLDDTGTNVLDSDVTDDLGAYSLTVNASTDVIVRVKAELIKGGSPSWDVEVRNNVVDPADPSPPALALRPIYVMDTAVMDSGVFDQTLDLTAATGWDGSSYTNPRAAAPFAVLDAIYSAMTLITGEDPNADFLPLDAFWSPDNTRTDGVPQDIDSGELGTSFYSNGQLFLLGKEGVDAEEFDDHVIVHEWGHYFEDRFSRSDSIGGAHGVGDLLDMRVAFGEGFATALSGIALNNPTYCDTLWSGGNLTGFEIDIESEGGGTAGWFNEISVMKLVYDLWDTADDGADNSSIGFGPIYNIMTGPQAATPAFTSIFSFASELKASLSAPDSAFVNALLTEQVIDSNIDIWATNETNDGGMVPSSDVIPVYTDLTLGVTERVCVSSQFDGGRDGNKLGEHRYLRLNIATPAVLTFTMDTVSPPSLPSGGFDCTADVNDPENHEHSDPDFIVWRNGSIFQVEISCEPNVELTTPVNYGSGDYVIDINEFRHEDEESPAGYPEQICFDFTAN